MATFEGKYWTLSQAAVWVVYRRRHWVDWLESASEYGFKSLKFYPVGMLRNSDDEDNEPESSDEYAVPIGSLRKLEAALLAGQIDAIGRRQGGSQEFVKIPAFEWADLSIMPPWAIRHDPLAGRTEPWRDILFESAEVKKLWRSENEVSGRTMHNWGVLQAIYEELRIENPDFTQNELVKEIQGTYRDRFNRKPPAESTIKERIKRWRLAGQPV